MSLLQRDKQPRVLFLNHAGRMGGAEHSLEALLTRLSVKVHVVLLSPGPLVEKLQQKNVSVTVMTDTDKLLSLGSETSFLSRLWAMRRLPGTVGKLTTEARRSDVVYANSKKALLFGALAAHRAHRPLIWHQRDAMHIPRALPMRAWLSESLLVHFLNRDVSRVISVSQASADTLIAAGCRPDLPIVIHNGLEPSCYAQPVDPTAERRSAGLPLDVPLIGCFGRLTRWKGQAVLIDALAHLPQAHVALVGGALFGESDYEADLRSRVGCLGLTGRVHFFGHRDDVPALMRAMDVVAHPSTEFDPCPRVVLEALHSEAPLVATAVGGVPELVEDGVNGLLVPPNDAPALASALEQVLTDGDLAARLAAAGRERALRCFTLDRVVREVERVIGETIRAAN